MILQDRIMIEGGWIDTCDDEPAKVSSGGDGNWWIIVIAAILGIAVGYLFSILNNLY